MTVSYPEAARRLLRDVVLDAARAEVEQRPWPEVTMADIAGRAGVSRQTLYNEFGSRDELAQALVLREEARIIAIVEDAVARNDAEPVHALEAAFATFLALAQSDPLVARIVAEDDADGLLPLVTTQGRPVVAAAAGRLTQIVCERWPAVPADAAELLCDCLVRLAISFAALPGGAPQETAARVVALLGPYVERVLASA